MHGFFGSDTVIEVNGHIGHGAVLHGCRIGRNAMIGMNAVIMDDAVIGESCIVAAAAFVKSGFIAPPRSLVVGAPARVTRELSDDEIAWKRQGTAQYHELTMRSLRSMRAVAPLTEAEPNRGRLRGASVTSPHKPKRKIT